MCEGVGKSGSPTSRWMASESSQASSMTSRMRETGIELAIDEGDAGLLPSRVLVSCGRNEFPPPPVSVAPSHRRLADPSPRPQVAAGVGLALEVVPDA